MEHCKAHKSVTKEVKEFLLNVDGAGEESITDFLLWKWKLIDNRFKSINVASFTRQKENKVTGADFEMEVWLVGRGWSYPLVFQAKKFIKPYDAYVSKLNYPKNTKKQMDTLLHYACSSKKPRIPFYAFYSVSGPKTKSMCRNNDVDECGVFMAHAKVVEKFADGSHGRKVSKNDLLAKSNPFHCMFCCPISIMGYFEEYFPVTGNEDIDQEYPEYVNYLLNTHPLEISKKQVIKLIEQHDLKKFRHVAVYDMREIGESPNNSISRYI